MQSTVSKREMSSVRSFFANDRTMLAPVLVNTLFIFVDAMANDNNDELMAKLEELEKKLDKLNESR